VSTGWAPSTRREEVRLPSGDAEDIDQHLDGRPRAVVDPRDHDIRVFAAQRDEAHAGVAPALDHVGQKAGDGEVLVVLAVPRLPGRPRRQDPRLSGEVGQVERLGCRQRMPDGEYGRAWLISDRACTRSSSPPAVSRTPGPSSRCSSPFPAFRARASTEVADPHSEIRRKTSSDRPPHVHLARLCRQRPRLECERTRRVDTSRRSSRGGRAEALGAAASGDPGRPSEPASASATTRLRVSGSVASAHASSHKADSCSLGSANVSMYRSMSSNRVPSPIMLSTVRCAPVVIDARPGSRTGSARDSSGW